MTTSGKWKKALLPSLGTRRKEHSSNGRLPTSRTVSDVASTAANQPVNEAPCLISGDDDLDDRVISALLETTAGTNNTDIPSGLGSQPRRITRSHTVGTMSSSAEPSTSVSPYRVQKSSRASPPQKSLRRNLQTITRDFSRLSPRRSPDGLVRPMSKSQSSHLLGGRAHRIAQSPSMSPGKPTGHRLRSSSNRKRDGDPEKISHSVTTVLAASNSLNGSSVAGSTDSAAASRMARFRKNKMLTKFAGVLSEHFSAKGSRKDDNVGGTTTASNDRPMKPIIHGLPLGRLTLAQLPLADQEDSGTMAGRHCNIDDDGVGKQEGNMLPGRADAGLSKTRKRLTLVDEVDIQHNGQPLDDPFSDFSSCHQSTEFDARLKSVQAPGAADQHASDTLVSDPFLAEQIMDTSANSILKTPPFGCSTPRTRNRSLVPCKSPIKGAQVLQDPAPEVFMISPAGGSYRSPRRRRKIAIICESPTRISSTSPGANQKENASCGSTGSPAKVRESSDSTRLSSYPPGSTIRHVPRSMGRLTDVPDLSVPSTMHSRPPLVARKKHPSPSKCQLDLYGKFIEKNLALGVFKDPDELAMNLDPHKGTSSPALTPRDKNRLLRGSAASNVDLRKGFNPPDLHPVSSTRSRSRIPQPVRQLTRSRTESAFVRDFLPANHGDLTAEDELQWDSSVYKVVRGRGGRCHHCGSMTEEGT